MFQAKLSKSGLEKMGLIFMDGEIPIKSNEPTIANVDGLGKGIRVFIMDYERLSDEKKSNVVSYLMEKFPKADITDLRNEIRKGIPVLEDDIDFVKAISLRMFI